MRGCEDEDEGMICEDEKVNMHRVKMYHKPLLLEEPFAQTLSGKNTYLKQRGQMSIQFFSALKGGLW